MFCPNQEFNSYFGQFLVDFIAPIISFPIFVPLMSQNGLFIRLVIVKVHKMDPEFERTYRDHYPKLFRIAAKMLQDPEGAKDVVQDVFTAYYFAMNNEKTLRVPQRFLLRRTSAEELRWYAAEVGAV